MIESIWPSEQLAMALTSPVDAQDVDPADPQVSYLQASMCVLVHFNVQTFCCICSSTRHKHGDMCATMSGQDSETDSIDLHIAEHTERSEML